MTNDDMSQYYASNPCHYSTGLTRIGCSVDQARQYSDYFDSLRFRYYHLILSILNVKVSHGKKNITVLDVGCGTGTDVRNLATKYPSVEFVGQELSKETRLICEEQTSKSQYPNVQFISGDFSQYSRRYDLVTSFCVLEHASNPIELILRMTRVMKKDGHLVIVAPNHLYSWYWCFPKYFVYSLITKFYPRLHVDPHHRDGIRTHSVESSLVMKGIAFARLLLLRKESYGYRPPQPFYRYYRPRTLRWLNSKFTRLDTFFYKLGLDPFLYLQVFIATKGASESTHAPSIRETELKGGVLSGLLLAGFTWSLYAWIDIVETGRKVWKQKRHREA
jgi:cyclopropane fatty-acyl-phospholipid synthase-like methyltransferase